ncbi:hypothetical protein TRFO_42700 [Tritrichomonas foetus]|uniref:F5/8 type C domain-containing protein n=1 Tax=Tritrichomonas foetus TaxID=1144522 RepID=A0A1J4KW76_9EUKA|nr:hypothetical protein TRFO_42700 [Tritrichomonas foetus]|eukprot:OHT15136.1 hypothetical protein TRFO_42700 [Tritrichomonas foetus]
MSKQSICAPPPADKDFTIIYNQHKIQISKFKLAVFSPRFRQIPNFIDTKVFSITGAAPIATFNVFIKGAQGEQLAITKENALDLVQLAEEWQVEPIKEEVYKFIAANPDLEAIFEKIKNTHEDGSTEALETVIASHLDAALELSSFQNFPLEVLSRILVSKDRILNNHHKLYTFVMKMFEIYDSKASVLIPGIDIRLLTPQEALSLLEHPALSKDNSNSATIDASTNLIRENVALKEEVSEIKNMMHDVLQRIQKLEEYNSKMAIQRKTIVEQTQKQYAEIIAKLDFLGNNGSPDMRLTKLDAKLDATAKTLRETQAKKVSDLETKTQKDLKKTQTTVDTLSKKISSIEAKYDMLTNDSAEIKKNLATIYQRAENVGDKIENQPGIKKVQSIPILYNGTSTNGIIAKLTQDAHGNVHENHVVSISASSNSHNFPYQVANTEWYDCWISQNKPDQWIQFDFMNKVVILQNYTIKTHRYSSGSCHLKSWKIEGSSNGETWEEIDKRESDVLNEENKEETFECAKKESPYRFIRLLQTGPNHRGDHMLGLSRIEFYGFLMNLE